MTWNYRVIDHGTVKGERWLAIHSVYYSADGKPQSYGEPGAVAGGETTTEVAEDLGRMVRALAMPPLKAKSFTTKSSWRRRRGSKRRG